MPTIQDFSLERVQELLVECGATRLAHGPNRTLNDHLCGTMKILSHWRQPNEVVVAGLLHSIYATDVYPQRLFPLSERRRVAKIAGAAGERLAYLFCSTRRDDLFDKLARAEKADWVKMHIECHQGEARAILSRADAGNLLIIHMANTAEQMEESNREPALWVAEVSRWANWARPLVKRVPPVFASCSAQVSLADEKAARQCYRAGLGMLGSNRAAARRDLRRAAEQLPSLAEPHALLAYSALLDGCWSDAHQHATTGLRRLEEWGTTWDKRLTFDDWKSIFNGLIKRSETGCVDPAKAVRAMKKNVRDGSNGWEEKLGSLSSTNPAPPAKAAPMKLNHKPPQAAALPPRFLSYISGLSRTDAAPKHNFYPGLRKVRTYPAMEFALTRALSASFADIRAEFRRLRRADGFQNEIEKIGRTGRWRIFPLYELGKRNDANCGKCPVTTSLIERHSAIHSISSAVYFSILAPRTHVAAHRGPTNMRLRCHLGIEVPDDCWLRVDQEIMTWHEGKCLIFDDSFVHEVWNDSDERRVVLVVDIWHPDLTAMEVRLLEGIQRYAYAHAAAMSGYWDGNERARADFGATRRPTRTKPSASFAG